MCGILGVVPSVERRRFEAALRLLAHRGPDGEGIWEDGTRAILGHRRLAILDTSDVAAQPMEYLGRYRIVFNGEIYNFLEVRRDLERAGHRFKTVSDTEVLVAAFAEWGHACLERLNGMWAFAIWDAREQQLFLSRDRLGEKPLYYLHHGERFAFASEQKALLPYLRDIRPSSRFLELTANPYAYEATSESLFRGLCRFPAAHYGILRDGRFTLTRYWVPHDRPVQVPVRYEEQVEALRALLLDACRIRMRSDVPIGTALSGGIDSSAVAACVSQVGRQGAERLPVRWQSAFVASFPNTVMDESDHAARVARHLGIDVERVVIEPGRHVERIEQWAYLFEEVHEVNPAPHILLYEALRRRGVVVSLDGHGGDELFCGYESSILHALSDAVPSLDSLRRVLDTYRECHPKNEHFRGMTLPEIVAYLLRNKVREWLQSDNQPSAKGLGSLNRHLYGLTFRSVLPTLLRNYDRYSMINGVEIRIPLLDPRVVEYALALPWQSKVRGGYTKAILRDAVAPWLPSDTVKRKDKIGFAPPIGDWMRGPLRGYLLDEIGSQSFKTATLIDPRRLAEAIRQLAMGEQRPGLYKTEQIWKQFGIYLWEKAFLQNGNRQLRAVAG